jgi:hypothetical protein
MIRKILHPVLALALAAGLATASVQQAEAGGRGVGVGIAAGIIGLGILGAAASARGDRDYDDYDEGRCYRGRPRCHWVERSCYENRYGDTICRGGERVCRRPLICD